MAERKDNKNRQLWKGEYQKSDGKYEYRYIDAAGRSRSVYSWTLTKSDKPPVGKKSEQCLREMEKQIMYDNHDEIDTYTAQHLSLNSFFVEYIKNRRLKDSTRDNYKYMYKKFVSTGLGKKKIADIKYSDIITFYNYLANERNFKPSSIENIQTILHPIFQTALRDGFIRVNPTEGALDELKRSIDWARPHRKALTVKQQEALLNFLSTSETFGHWKPLVVFILGTGCRIGETLGLTWNDCDFKNNIISINHSVIYRLHSDGTCRNTISTPKTNAGIREIPMFKEVRSALLAQREDQMRRGVVSEEIDGYSGFVFTNRFNNVHVPNTVNKALSRIYNEYNTIESTRAFKEGRDPVILPHFSAHHLRHTFCTRMCENTSDKTTLKTIQTIMGHADISTTLDVYTDLTRDKLKESFEDLQDKIKIS